MSIPVKHKSAKTSDYLSTSNHRAAIRVSRVIRVITVVRAIRVIRVIGCRSSSKTILRSLSCIRSLTFVKSIELNSGLRQVF